MGVHRYGTMHCTGVYRPTTKSRLPARIEPEKHGLQLHAERGINFTRVGDGTVNDVIVNDNVNDNDNDAVHVMLAAAQRNAVKERGALQAWGASFVYQQQQAKESTVV